MEPLTAIAPGPGPTSANSAAAPVQDQSLRQIAEEFEAVFLSTVISRMFQSLPVDGPFGGGHAEATYRTFLAEEYASALSRQGGIGIADDVYADLLRIQEEAAQ